MEHQTVPTVVFLQVAVDTLENILGNLLCHISDTSHMFNRVVAVLGEKKF